MQVMLALLPASACAGRQAWPMPSCIPAQALIALLNLHGHANRSIPCAKGNSTATGRIAGVVKDQTGAVVPGVRIEALRLASGIKRSLDDR